MKNFNDSLIKKMERLAEITISSLQLGKMARTKRCLALAEELLVKGNVEMKNAITNVYLFSVSHYMEMNRLKISQLLPISLHKEYVKQINTSGV
ncbi:hypothetical protein GGR22_002054 [Flavobacterium gossypii]|jgi:hypothetical protein|uniref:DUF7674 domain-containing protein n=2 Tax=Flavobacterium TaxID=237 RepID=A0A495MCL5_9FLAO|nr:MULTISPECIES: hypothetical protein [Flavobacterium]MBA9073887.1 hypothetical protein [Flavobacterium gossypii]RKS23075.1 hypothetical protein CLV94_1978 [Flavobacterium endophyticum]WDO11958.1 hypothetical protein MH928_11525 [Flavobacterium sp. WW92]